MTQARIILGGSFVAAALSIWMAGTAAVLWSGSHDSAVLAGQFWGTLPSTVGIYAAIGLALSVASMVRSQHRSGIALLVAAFICIAVSESIAVGQLDSSGVLM